MDSPPRFSDGSPRFTEDFSSSPPYSQPPHYGVDTQAYSPHGSIPSMQHRLSNKERPMSPELSSAFPEHVRAAEGDKEVVAYQQPQPLPYQRPADGSGGDGRRILGMRSKWFYGLLVPLVVLVVLGIGLGVGLGVGLGNQKSHSATSTSPANTSSTPTPSPTPNADSYAIGGAINPEYYTSKGAFNGSGIALASQSFASNLQDAPLGSLVMYYQHHSGDIRFQRLTSEGAWVGGTQSEIVASNAKNSTPLSAVAYVQNGTSQWHVFYIGDDNQLKQRSNSNTTSFWSDGPLNDMNLTVLDADQVGVQACWYGNAYGDTDYVHTDRPSTGSTAASVEYGMHLWYASDNTTFKQIGWRYGDDEWSKQQDWKNLNGHAGVGCYSWGEGTVTYVMFVDLLNTVNFYWKDTDTNTTSTESHPINVWTNSSISIPNVNPSTSLGYTNYFYTQMADTNAIMGYNISWNAENTTIVDKDTFTVGNDPGLPGTHLSVTALPNQSGGDDINVFYQTVGDDVTEYTRDLEVGQWSEVNIDIPDS